MSDTVFNLTLTGTLDDLRSLARGIGAEPPAAPLVDQDRLRIMEESRDAVVSLLTQRERDIEDLSTRLAKAEQDAAAWLVASDVSKSQVKNLEEAARQLEGELERLRTDLTAARKEAAINLQEADRLAAENEDLLARLTSAHSAEHAEPAEPAGEAPAPEPLALEHADPDPHAPADDFRDIWIDGRRGEHFDFIAEKRPTLSEFRERFEIKNHQSGHNRLFELRQALKGRVVIDLIEGRLTPRRLTGQPIAVEVPSPPEATEMPQPEAQEPEPPPAAPVAIAAPAQAPAPEPPPEPARLAAGQLCRVAIHLLTVTGPKGAARVNSSLFAKVLAHMSDGQMYGLNKLRTVGGYANEDAIRTAFVTHRPMLARIGLSYYIDKINARLTRADDAR